MTGTVRRAIVAALAAVLVAVVVGPAAGAQASLAPGGEQLSVRVSAQAGPVSAAGGSVVGDPLLIVMDLSDSMNEPALGGAAGATKLDVAKRALRDVVHEQPAGSQLGLWTYPAGDCEAGGYVSGGALGTLTDTAALEAQINALQAGGNTPTAAALDAAVASLKAQGINSANVLLVSDGESNCEGDPCVAAKQIVAAGFDITVQAMGFDISDAGRQELSCIANTTNGRYYDVTDASQLGTLLGDLAVARLRADVVAPTPVVAGAAGRVQVSVTNPSQQGTADVSVSLSFSDGGDQSVFPAAVPPTYRLGNVPAGSTVKRQWTFSTPSNRTGIAYWKVTTTAPKLGSVTSTGQIVIVRENLTLADGGPVLQRVGDGKVVILGDSYSSGEGTHDYVTLENETQTKCHRSMSTYAVALYGKDNVANLACSGAVLAHFQHRNVGRDIPAQLDQVAYLDKQPSLVLLTMSGNDIGFADIINRCVVGTSVGHMLVEPHNDCTKDQEFVARTAASIDALSGKVKDPATNQMRPRLELAYEQVWQAVNPSTRKGPPAAVIVLAYPQVLPAWQRASCPGFNANEVRFGNAVVAALNAKVRQATDALAARGENVYFASGIQDAVLPEHTACSDDPYIEPVSVPSGFVRGITDKAPFRTTLLQELMHPKVTGYTAETNALVTWSKSVELIDAKVSTAPARPLEFPKRAVKVEVAPGVTDPVRVGAGEGLDLRLGGGVSPDLPVTVTVHSTPQVLGVFEPNSDGSASAVVTLPDDLALGRHTLEVTGTSADGQPFTYTRTVLVGPPAPSWLMLAWVGAALAAVGAVTLATLAVRRRRSAEAGQDA